MFLVWSGWGILVIPVVLVVTTLTSALLQVVLGAMGYPNAPFVSIGVGLLAAAAATWVFGRWLNNKPGRELLDPRTQQRVVLRRVHRLFWIKVEYWAIPIALLALVSFLGLLDKHPS